MNLQTRKLDFIQEILQVNSEKLFSKLELVLKKEQQNLNPILKEKLTSRALKANKDIVEGKVYTRKGAEAKLKEQLNI